MFLKAIIFIIILNIYGVIFTRYKLININILLILYLIIIKYNRYETFISEQSQEKINNIIDNEILQNVLDKFIPYGKCVGLKKFKKIVYNIIDAVSFIPKAKVFIKLFVTDTKIDTVFKTYCNKKKKICRKDVESIITSLLKKFLK